MDDLILIRQNVRKDVTPPNHIYVPNGSDIPKGIAHLCPLLMRFYIFVVLIATIRRVRAVLGVIIRYLTLLVRNKK